MVTHWPRRYPGVVFALIALAFLGSLFPRGYMPVSDGGRITVTLCSAYGEQRRIEIDLGKADQPARHTGSNSCDGLVAAIMPVAAPLVVPFFYWVAVVPLAPRRQLVPHLFHFDPNAPPHAPPVSAV